jgi:hypothetical protein
LDKEVVKFLNLHYGTTANKKNKIN